MENEASRDAHIVLHLLIRDDFGEARREIFDLSGTERQTMEKFYVDTAAERNRTKHRSKLSSDGLVAVANK
jgi:hypothetical protein